MVLPYNWRVTKFNPARRDAQGLYPGDEWYLFSDIGEVFDGKPLTYEDYYKYESAYADAAVAFLSATGLVALRAVKGGDSDIYIKNTDPCRDIALVPTSVKAGALIQAKDLADVVRLNLREVAWCELQAFGKFYLHFGWDFYMFIGSADPCIAAIQAVEESGLFVEEFMSPYL